MTTDLNPSSQDPTATPESSPTKPESDAFPRRKLPLDREGTRRTLRISRPKHPSGDLVMEVTINCFPGTRKPAEIFIYADKAGTMAAGALDTVAVALSVAWQFGAPFEGLMRKLVGLRFEPEGLTGDPKYPFASSPLDLVARWALDTYSQKEPSEIPHAEFHG